MVWKCLSRYASTSASIDYRLIRDNMAHFIQNAKNRNVVCDPQLAVNVWSERNALKMDIQALQQERNGLLKSVRSSEDAENIRERGKEIRQLIAEKEIQFAELDDRLRLTSRYLPNDTHPEVPVGREEDSVEMGSYGTRASFDFEPLGHKVLAERLQLVDFNAGAKLAGGRFAMFTNDGVLLELALIQWAISKLRSRGFKMTAPPDVVKRTILEGCGYSPKSFNAQIYKIQKTNLCLSGTSEVALAGMYSNSAVFTKDLPIRLGAVSHCFRTETGHGGAMGGLYRLHQFSKVEMFALCTELQAEEMMSELLDLQIEMYKELDIHFKVLDMASEDLGASAYRKYDILAWMPGRQQFGEISSLSNCTDFQSRRLNIRHQKGVKTKTSYATTLNGTACAIPRILLTILETHQQKDGSVRIPDALRPFMGNQEYIQ